MKPERVGYLGGTFDPPHLGHEILAQEALYQLKLDQFNWLITPFPPHKGQETVTPIEQRLDMLQLVMQANSNYQISRLDLERPAPHYAADSVELIKDQFPEKELIYVMGQDSLADLPKWYQPQRFLAMVDMIAVAPRPGQYPSLQELEGSLPGITEKTHFLSEVMIEISSSLIKERVLHRAPYRHFLNPAVAEYIEKVGLYTEKLE